MENSEWGREDGDNMISKRIHSTFNIQNSTLFQRNTRQYSIPNQLHFPFSIFHSPDAERH